jgi:hypothetical protein
MRAIFVLPLMPLLYFSAINFLSPSFKEVQDFNHNPEDEDLSSNYLS